MPALKNSWPLPPNSSDRPPVNSATTQAPSTPAATPPAIHSRAAGNARRHRHDDADDQAGLEDFAKDDQQRRKHGTLMTLHWTTDSRHDQKPCVAWWKSSKKL